MSTNCVYRFSYLLILVYCLYQQHPSISECIPTAAPQQMVSPPQAAPPPNRDMQPDAGTPFREGKMAAHGWRLVTPAETLVLYCCLQFVHLHTFACAVVLCACYQTIPRVTLISGLSEMF